MTQTTIACSSGLTTGSAVLLRLRMNMCLPCLRTVRSGIPLRTPALKKYGINVCWLLDAGTKRSLGTTKNRWRCRLPDLSTGKLVSLISRGDGYTASSGWRKPIFLPFHRYRQSARQHRPAGELFLKMTVISRLWTAGMPEPVWQGQ